MDAHTIRRMEGWRRCYGVVRHPMFDVLLGLLMLLALLTHAAGR